MQSVALQTKYVRDLLRSNHVLVKNFSGWGKSNYVDVNRGEYSIFEVTPYPHPNRLVENEEEVRDNERYEIRISVPRNMHGLEEVYGIFIPGLSEDITC